MENQQRRWLILRFGDQQNGGGERQRGSEGSVHVAMVAIETAGDEGLGRFGKTVFGICERVSHL